MRQVQLVCKYIFDLLAGVLGLIVLSPVLLVVSCAIIINDPGPVFF